ncbi:MAG: hypothetical protein SCH68_05170 [Brevefilum sp.]|nr:hypothetical protein [Brevefilum sp.]
MPVSVLARSGARRAQSSGLYYYVMETFTDLYQVLFRPVLQRLGQMHLGDRL